MNANAVIVIALVMVFATVVLSVQGVYFYTRGKKDEVEEKIRHRLGFDPNQTDEEMLASLLREQAADGMLERLGKQGEEMQATIRQAGMDITVSTLVGYMAFASLLATTLAFVAVGPKAMPPALLLGYVPLAWVRRRAAARAKALLEQMPDALEMMGRAMQAGAGLVDCFRLVQDEMSDPVATEFGRISDEVRFGKDWREALEQLLVRNPSLFELRLLVSSLLLQRETGGNMIETVNRISKLIRQRAAFDGKVKAMTAEARTSGLVLALMPIGVLILIVMANAPYLTPLVDTAVGQMVIVYAISSYAIGIFIMQASSKVEA
ncbi:MAG: type II secretion system F family protein [Alphaproteobacteria bacterium]|nr:type II secretion system F family protein [Alphaproteobacteria bacterium]